MDVPPVFLWVAALAAAVSGFIYIVRHAWIAIKLAPQIAEGLTLLIGTQDPEDDHPPPLGMRLIALEEDAEYIKDELTINGGSSVKDRVIENARQLDNIVQQNEAILLELQQRDVVD